MGSNCSKLQWITLRLQPKTSALLDEFGCTGGFLAALARRLEAAGTHSRLAGALVGVSATGFLGLVLHFLHVAIDEAANLNWVDLPSLAVADLKYKKMQIPASFNRNVQ